MSVSLRMYLPRDVWVKSGSWFDELTSVYRHFVLATPVR
jgi:hypothetical protein